MRKPWLFTLLLSLSLATTSLIAACNKVPQIHLEKATACSGLGRTLGDKRDLDKAIAKALDFDSYLAIAREIQGGVQHNQKKLDQAITTYREAIRLDPNDVGAYNSLGIVLYDKGKVDEAISVWRQVIQLDPDNISAHNNLGLAMVDQNKLAQAITFYRKTIELAPNCALAYSNLGIALAKQNKLDDATMAYRRAIQLDPNYATAYLNLGWLLHIEKKPDKAIEAYRQALRLPEDKSSRPASVHTMAHNNLGLALQQQGKLEEAIEEYKWAILLDRKFVNAQNNLKESQRLLKLKQHPPTAEHLPSPDQEPLVFIKRSIVKIVVTKSASGKEYGTGWVVKREGNTALIVTNRHVVTDEFTGQQSEEIKVEFYSIDPVRPQLDAKIVEITTPDNQLDLAVLKVTNIPEDIEPLSIESTNIVNPTSISVIGHPSLGSELGSDWTVEPGTVSNANDKILRLSQVTISQGNSGGPVINQQKQVVGVVVGSISPDEKAGDTAGIGVAYPIKRVNQQLHIWGIL